MVERAVAPHMTAAMNLARWLMRDPHDAEDALQEAYLRAFASFDQLRAENPRGWLLTIVRNVCYTALRRDQSDKHEELDDRLGAEHLHGEASPEATLLRRAEARTINEAVAALKVEHREVFILREVEGLSYKEIADVVAVPIGTVMSRLSRARAELQRELALEGDER